MPAPNNEKSYRTGSSASKVRSAAVTSSMVATLADGSYPFTLSYYGLYWPSHPQARQIDAILQGVQAMQTAD